MNSKNNTMNMDGNELLKWALESTDSPQFQEWYNDYVQSTVYKKIRNKYQRIDNELISFSVISDKLDRNDYVGFRMHVMSKIIADQKKKRQNVSARYNHFLRPMNYEELPESIFYVWYFAHLYKKAEDLHVQNCVWLDAANEKTKKGVYVQYTTQQENIMKEMADLGLKIFFLTSLFENDAIHIPYLRALAESLEMENSEYVDDDLENLTTCQVVKMRFFSSLIKGKKLETYKLLGMLIPHKKELDSGEYDYFEAMVRLRDGDYEGALRYADKVQPGNVDYGAVVAMKLECLAWLGDIDAFTACLKNELDPSGKYTYTSAFLRLWIAQLLLHASDTDFDVWAADASAVDTFESACHSAADGNEKDPINTIECYRLTCKILEELFTAIEQDAYAAAMSDDFTPDVHTEARKQHLIVALEWLHVCADEEIVSLKKYLIDPDAVVFDELKESISDSIINKILPNELINPVTDIRCICSVSMFIYNLGYIERFVEYVKINIDLFSDSELHKANAEVLNILHLAYVEAIVHNIPCEKLTAIVEEKFAVSEDTVKTAKIKNMLSLHGKKAYESALWQYEKSLQEDYGWKDAGMIALAFYRIIELEINERVIKPLAARLTVQDLENKFTARWTALNRVDSYKNSWNTVKGKLKKHITNPQTADNLMLGELDVLFRNLTNRHATADDLAIYINNALLQVCDYRNADIPFLVSYQNREKYRNPPAHTKYLPHNVARECKTFVEAALPKIFSNLIN